MPVVFGVKKENGGPEDAFSALLECHVRIRRFTSLALKLSAPPEGSAADEIKEAARDVIRYFTVALPLHEQDEELSLAPRLRDRDLPPAARSMLEALAPEHRAIEDVLGTLVPDWTLVSQDAKAAGRGLAKSSARLAELFEAHLLREERDLFPAARSALTAPEIAAVHEVMRSRRR
jgi:hemerythrin-like domain-containing protein